MIFERQSWVSAWQRRFKGGFGRSTRQFSRADHNSTEETPGLAVDEAASIARSETTSSCFVTVPQPDIVRLSPLDLCCDTLDPLA